MNLFARLKLLASNPIFRWAVVCALLILIAYLIGSSSLYVSMGHGLILDKRTGDVHRAYDRIVTPEK